jgi:hypothetical protein
MKLVKGRRRDMMGMLTAVVLLAVLLSSVSANSSNPGQPLLNDIGGIVSFAGTDKPVIGAEVVTARANLVRVATTNERGEYTISDLIGGSYTVSVRPVEPPSTVSPDWVFTDEPQVIDLPPSRQVNLSVTTADVTVVGSLAAPGSIGFSEGNRAWVRAENQEGQGNTVQVSADGQFSIQVLPGAVLLRVVLENPAWATAPEVTGMAYFGESGETILVDGDPGTTAIDPIGIDLKAASITGQVRVQGGASSEPGVAIPVRAWRIDGTEYEQTLTDEAGNYVLPITEGSWLIRAVPGSGQDFVPAESPQLQRGVQTGEERQQDLLIAVADVEISGRAVDSVSGEALGAGADGRVYSLYRDPASSKAIMGPAAALVDGEFTLKLAASVAMSYSVGLHFPMDGEYTALSRAQLNLNNPPASLDIPVAADNSRISGTLRNRDGSAARGVPAVVLGASDSGGWARTYVNPVTANYRLDVVSTELRGNGGSTWRVRPIVDPSTGYVLQRPALERVFLPYNNGEGSNVGGIDFTVIDIDSLGRISGQVLGPGDEPAKYARVAISEISADSSTALRVWTYTNREGWYERAVPPGRYRVTAYWWRQGNRIIDPAPVQVEVATEQQVAANLSFRSSDVTLSGSVSYQGAAYPGLVRARSEDGAVVHSRAQDDGQYELALRSGLSWTIQAVSSDESSFLRSQAEQAIPAISNSTATLPELVLELAAPIPESQIFSFEAELDQIFTMGDGSQVQVPAGAIQSSGSTILTVRPLPELQSAGNLEPISFGYRLNAYDSNRRPLSKFASPVTLILPFAASDLAALGVTPEQLVPAYWDEATSSWKPVENVIVVVDQNGDGEVQISVDHFTDFALLAGLNSGALQSYLPVIIQ